MSIAARERPDRRPLPSHRLLVTCPVCTPGLAEPAAVRRGMPVEARDGEPVGAVAAVVWACRRRRATHVLLGHLPPSAIYHLVPLHLIAAIDQRSIRLKTARHDVAQLPVYQPA